MNNLKKCGGLDVSQGLGERGRVVDGGEGLEGDSFVDEGLHSQREDHGPSCTTNNIVRYQVPVFTANAHVSTATLLLLVDVLTTETDCVSHDRIS